MAIKTGRHAPSTLRPAFVCHGLAAITLLGCSASPPAAEPVVGHGSSRANAGDPAVVSGFPVRWIHGSADCKQNADPELQVHAYDATTYIIRQNKCRTFEAPFVYLLIGAQSALLLDTGATDTATLRDTVKRLIGSKPLLVAHSHGHGDHIAGDATFAGQPGVTVVASNVAAIQAAFGITRWPDAAGSHQLGGRALDVIAIPGHHATHIAVHDQQTGLLFTGDTLYPGLLYVRDWAAYRSSIRRLAAFAGAHPIKHVLGAHIEMTADPKINYPPGTPFQPREHVLQLTADHLRELDTALTRLGPDKPGQPEVHDDFVITPM